jgi:hypothetical protein
MNDEKLIIECDENTQFVVEKRGTGHSKIWSDGPEICIAHILKGKRSQYGPSIPLDRIPELSAYLTQAYGDLRENPSGQ